MEVMMVHNIEKKLDEEKSRMDAIKAPKEIEMILSETLNTVPPKKYRKTNLIWKIALTAIILFSVTSYNYNALAYYSKKIFGFDEVLSSTLKELNEADMGQVIEKSIQLENGTKLTVNGIMTDENQLVLFYTLKNPDGLDGGTIMFDRITGFLTNSTGLGGTGNLNEDGTVEKGMYDFKAVNPFAKKLTLQVSQFLDDAQVETTEISFAHDPNKAMQTDMKRPLKETFHVDKGNITFNSIIASPTLTVIEGSLDIENFDRFDFPFEEIHLTANGKPVAMMGGGSTSSVRGTEFDLRYDALPKDLNSLQLEMREFTGYEEINQKISLDTEIDEIVHLHDEQELLVKEVKETPTGTEITIATNENVILDGVSIGTKDGVVSSLKTTIREDIKAQKNGRYMKERTLIFDTRETAEYLSIKGIHYMKTYNKIIEIPVK